MANSLRAVFSRPLTRYALAVAVVAVTFPLRTELIGLTGAELPPFILLYPALMIVAIACGRGPGILATLLGVLGSDYLIFPPVHHLAITQSSDAISLGVFAAMGLLMSVLAERHRQSERAIAVLKSERAQREAEALYQNLFNSMDEGFCVIEMIFDASNEAIDFRFLEVSDSYVKQTKIPNPLGKTIREVVPDLERYWFDVYGKVALTGEPAHVINESKAFDSFFDVRAYRVGEAEQRRVAVVFTDISRRMREERALREQADLIELASCAIMVRGLDGTIRFWNRGAEEMYGFSREEAMGRTSHELLRTEFPQPLAEIEAIVPEEGRWDGELTHFAKDGGRLVVASRWALQVETDGHAAGIMEINNDISERKRAEEHTRKLNRVYTVLSDINQTIVREKNSSAMLEAACRIAVEKGKFRMAWIGMINPETQELEPVASSGRVEGYLNLVKINLQKPGSETGPVEMCFRTGMYATCDDIEHQLFRPWKGEALRQGFRSVAAFPLRCEGSMIGVLCLYAGELAFFDDDEIHVLDEMAMDISFALEVNRHEADRRRGEQHIRELNRVYAVLSGINETIVREKDSQAMLESACQIAVEKGKFLMAWIGMIDPATQQPVPIASCGEEDGYLKQIRVDYGSPKATGPLLRCIASGVHAICNDIENDLDPLPWQREALLRGYRSSAAFPLKVDGKTIGVFSLYADRAGFFVGDELSLLDEMAMNISFALEVNRHEQERSKADEQLRGRTAFFEALVDCHLDGVLVIDSQGKKILQNQRLIDILGIPPAVAENSEDAQQLEFVAPLMKDPGKFVEQALHLSSHPDEISRDEIEMVNGTVLDRYSAPVRDKAMNYYGRIWTLRDITERRQLEAQFRQAQKMEAIGQLTGGIAHDFNNLLTVMLGCSEFIADEVKDNARLVKMAEMIVSASKRGTELTHRMLAFARRQTLQPRPVDINQLLSGMESFLRRTLSADIELHLTQAATPCEATVDPTQLESALLNLCVNARDAMKDGGKLTIEVCCTALDAEYAGQNVDVVPGEYVLLAVSDTGCGISQENIGRVFDPFFTTKEVGKGTGLGLSMVYGFVKQSQGHLKVYSEVDHGTSVKVYLPKSSQKSESTIPDTACIADLQGTELILLVEDNQSVREFVKMRLASLGYRVVEATNGPEALEVLEARKDVNLLFTDMIMPGGLNGRELARKACMINPTLKVLYSSGYAENAALHQGLLESQMHFLNKPYTQLELARQIRGVLAES